MAQHEKIFPHVLSKAKMDSLRRIFSKKKSQGNDGTAINANIHKASCERGSKPASRSFHCQMEHD